MTVGSWCPRCGAGVLPNDRFCGRCGAPAAAGFPPYGSAPPVFLRRADFGSPLSDWWPRVGAMLLDSLVLLVPSVAISLVVSAETTAGSLSGVVLRYLLLAAVTGVYFTLLNGRRTGQTVGNLAAGIAVRDAVTGQVIGFSRGLLRWFVRFALYLFLIPGVLNDLWPLWDRQNQTFADKAARSVMIRVR